MPAKPADDTSVTLMMRLQRSPADPRAWSEFVERYRPMIRAWCLRWHLQESDADDVSQEVLLKLLNAIRKFQYDPQRSFRAWLKTITQHALADFVAARRKDPGPIADRINLIADSADAQSDLERQFEEAFDAEVLELAMERVKSRVKPMTWAAFQLTTVDGLSGVAAAESLQMPVAHVFVAKSRVQKMLQKETRVSQETGKMIRRDRPGRRTLGLNRSANGLCMPPLAQCAREGPTIRSPVFERSLAGASGWYAGEFCSRRRRRKAYRSTRLSARAHRGARRGGCSTSRIASIPSVISTNARGFRLRKVWVVRLTGQDTVRASIDVALPIPINCTKLLPP